MTDTDKMRNDFDAELVKRFGEGDNSLLRDEHGDYLLRSVHDMWIGYQAGRAAAEQELTTCRHCGFRVKLNEAPQEGQS